MNIQMIKTAARPLAQPVCQMKGESKLNRFFSILLALCLILSAAGCGGAGNVSSLPMPSEESAVFDEASSEESAPEESAPDPWVWQTDLPENHGVRTEDLASIHQMYDTFPLFTSVIVKDGVLIDSYYKEGYDETSVLPLHSVTKSITSALIGVAIDRGEIPGVDALLSDYFPEILTFSDERWQRITLRHLLTHTSGIATTDSSIWGEWRASDNWIEYLFALPITAEPGTHFSYSTGNTHLLAAVLERATGKSLSQYAQEFLFDPVGMESARIGTDPQDVGDGGNGGEMTVLDMAKFGLLYLNNGVWQDRQVIPAEWVTDSTTMQFDRSEGVADYGYQWWVRTFRGHPAYFAQGYAGQFIFVVPELSLVIAMQSNYEGSSSIYWQLASDIVAACEG